MSPSNNKILKWVSRKYSKLLKKFYLAQKMGQMWNRPIYLHFSFLTTEILEKMEIMKTWNAE